MRHNGRITIWKDDKGFGFVTPDDGGRDIFIHISSFASGERRPAVNELVTYKTARDTTGRLRGVDVAFVGRPSRSARQTKPVHIATVLAALFLSFVLGAVLLGHLPFAVFGAYFGISILSFWIYAIDKSAARNDRWRTAENTFHLLGILGGWPGALVAQKVFRHKQDFVKKTKLYGFAMQRAA
jgi:uncharacterized membrane protein YsdA (DUF1294 family)/cold shock CspA family protein